MKPEVRWPWLCLVCLTSVVPSPYLRVSCPIASLSVTSAGNPHPAWHMGCLVRGQGPHGASCALVLPPHAKMVRSLQPCTGPLWVFKPTTSFMLSRSMRFCGEKMPVEGFASRPVTLVTQRQLRGVAQNPGISAALALWR